MNDSNGSPCWSVSPLARSNQFMMSRRASSSAARSVNESRLMLRDVPGLVAATLARHGAVTAGRPRSNHAVFV